MAFTLSLNTNPLVNRFAEPDDLVDTIADGIGIRDVQLTHEFINPGWPAATIAKFTRLFQKALARTGVRVTSGMTGPYGRLNHFGHPDADVRRYYVDWFKIFADVWAELGAAVHRHAVRHLHPSGLRRSATPPAAEADRDRLLERGRRARQGGGSRLSHLGADVGRPRIRPHASRAAARCRTSIDAAEMAIPLKMMIDIDHGDVTSTNPADTDPYAWAENFAAQSPIIHIKQSSMNKGGHWPFTAAYNKDGRITPEKFLETLRRGGGSGNEICLELSFREREPIDRQVVAMIRESVDYWAPYIETGRAELAGRG